MKNLLTKEQAMKKFGITDLREFNTKDFIKVMSSIDKMDPEVAKELIGQIPNFLSFAKETVTNIKESYTEVLKADDESLNKIYASYDLLIDSLNENLQDKELSLDEKFEISKMIRDIIHDKEDLHFKQLEKRHELFAKIATGAIAATAVVVGLLSGSSLIKSNSEDPTHEDTYS